MEMSLKITKDEVIESILLEFYKRGAEKITKDDIKVIPHTSNTGELDYLEVLFNIRKD